MAAQQAGNLTTDKREKDPPSDVKIQACLFNPKAKPLLQTAGSIWIGGQRNGESGQPIWNSWSKNRSPD